MDLDGRINSGDMILQINEIGLENLCKDYAIKVLNEAVQTPGPIKLIIAKNWVKIDAINLDEEKTIILHESKVI